MKGDVEALRKFMRQVYNAYANDAGNNPTTVVLPCENCGDLVMFSRAEDGTTEVIHVGCEHAQVTMETMNPRRLGVITSVT